MLEGGFTLHQDILGANNFDSGIDRTVPVELVDNRRRVNLQTDNFFSGLIDDIRIYNWAVRP